MISETDINEYIKMCINLGSYHELIQGSGGNFSLKTDHEIIIKSSGRVLAETTINSGYVICSLKMLNECIEDATIPIKSTVLRGEENGIPSMEVFFHLLPYKWIIHIHPISFLVHLCQSSWSSLISSYKCSYIPYITPGKDLGTTILEKYKNEQVLFLQNHGIIICGNSIDEIYIILDDLYKINIEKDIYHNTSKYEYANIYNFKKYIEEKVEQPIVFKPCRNINKIYERMFFSITPDISLFLKEAPLVQEYRGQIRSKLFDEYYNLYKYIPSVLQLGDTTYVCGKSYRQCILIEDILDSYLEIIQKCDKSMIIKFNKDNIKSLHSSENEIHRLNML